MNSQHPRSSLLHCLVIRNHLWITQQACIITRIIVEMEKLQSDHLKETFSHNFFHSPFLVFQHKSLLAQVNTIEGFITGWYMMNPSIEFTCANNDLCWNTK